MRLLILSLVITLVSCNGEWHSDCDYGCNDGGYYCDYCGEYIPPYYPPGPYPPPEPPDESCNRVESWQKGYKFGYEDGRKFGFCQGAPETNFGDYICNTDYLNGYHAGCWDGLIGNPEDDTPPWIEEDP